MKDERVRKTVSILCDEDETWYCDGDLRDTREHKLRAHVVRIDLGDGLGLLYHCLECLERRIGYFLESINDGDEPQSTPGPDVHVNGDTLTIDGISFQF